MARYNFSDYWYWLDGAGPKLKERILDHAAHNPDIDLHDLNRLASKAFPDFD